MPTKRKPISRRKFVQSVAAASVGPLIVPRHVLGGAGFVAPSDTFGGALIGCGGRGNDTYNVMCRGLTVRRLADCDVRYCDRADNQTIYTDFRRVLDRRDIDLVAIATPPHWHALICIAAAQAGKDIMCEKPLTKSIAEGRAVVNAVNRYGRILQVCTFGRFGASGSRENILTHKIMKSGLLRDCQGVYIKRGGFKVREWSGQPNLPTASIPANLDWDMYCGPAPLKPYVTRRVGGTHRCYWDYEGGGLSDMGQHFFDPVQWTFAKDDTSPVEVEAYAPPAHPEVTGMWGWVELKYADGLTFVLESGEWGQPYDRKTPRNVSLNDLNEQDRATVMNAPNPEPLVNFADAVRTRRRPGGHAEAAHRAATILHLANISIRVGRKIRFDPATEQIVGDEEANRLANPPMRGPWHL